MSFLESWRRIRNRANLEANEDKVKRFKANAGSVLTDEEEQELYRLNKKVGAEKAREDIFEERAQKRIKAAEAPKIISDNRRTSTHIKYSSKKGVNDNTVAIANKSGGKPKTTPKKKSTRKPKKR